MLNQLIVPVRLFVRVLLQSIMLSMTLVNAFLNVRALLQMPASKDVYRAVLA